MERAGSVEVVNDQNPVDRGCYRLLHKHDQSLRAESEFSSLLFDKTRA